MDDYAVNCRVGFAGWARGDRSPLAEVVTRRGSAGSEHSEIEKNEISGQESLKVKRAGSTGIEMVATDRNLLANSEGFARSIYGQAGY